MSKHDDWDDWGEDDDLELESGGEWWYIVSAIVIVLTIMYGGLKLFSMIG